MREWIDADVVIKLSELEQLAGHQLPAYQAQARPKKDPTIPDWHVPEPKATWCEHRQDDLCGDCAKLLAGLEADMPALIHDLGLALTLRTRFAPRGHRKGDTEHPDESQIPLSLAASARLSDFHTFLAQRPTLNRHEALKQLSMLAEKAHRTIDRPKDRIYTRCPLCSEDIWLDQTGPVACTKCHSYTADTWTQHESNLIAANLDAMLTMTELVSAITTNRDPAACERTRNRIRYLERRHGLARERIQRPQWGTDGENITEAKWGYRLGDVLDLLDRKKTA